VVLSVEVDPAAAQLKFRVCDTGPGIPGENHAVIFEPFFTTKQDGSGLGLWIVQQIGVAHGGAVTVANAPGGGAIFTLHLPLSGPEIVHG
jgi:two-component system sensor histidine kinase HydH